MYFLRNNDFSAGNKQTAIKINPLLQRYYKVSKYMYTTQTW